MAHSRAGRLALLLDLLPFHVQNFSIVKERLNVPKLVLELPLLILASEEINAVDYLIGEAYDFVTFFAVIYHRAGSQLHHRFHLLLEIYSCPVIVLKIKSKHIIGHLSILVLASKNNHGVAINGTAMVVSGLNADALCLDDVHCSFQGIINHYLVDMLSYLSLSIIHVAASKTVNQVVVHDGGMAASSDNLIVVLHFQILPVRMAVESELRHFFVRVIVLTTDQVCLFIAAGQCRVLAGCWRPVLDG